MHFSAAYEQNMKLRLVPTTDNSNPPQNLPEETVLQTWN